MHKPLTVPALSLCIVTLWACSHDTTAPPEGRPIGVFSVQPSAGRGLPIHNIIDLTLSVQGTLTPGSPVNVSVDAKSFYDIGDVLITISLPEVAVAAADGWTGDFTVPVAIPIQPQAARTVTFGRGQSAHFATSVAIEKPGYYRVVARAIAQNPLTTTREGLLLSNSTVREGWLLVTESGGEFRWNYQPSVVPEGHVRLPGPFRKPSRATSANHSDRPGEVPDHGPYLDDVAGDVSPMDVVTYQVLYYDDDEMSYLPLADAYYAVRGCTLEPEQFICEEYQFEEFATGYTDGSGYFSFACTGDEYEGEAVTYSPSIGTVDGGGAPISGDIGSDCNSSFQTIMPNDCAKVYINLRATYAGTYALFGVSRGFIDVSFDADTSQNSYYDSGSDEIVIVVDQIWGEAGVFVLAHEYGHAYHEVALSGNEASGYCPSWREFNIETNLQCAYSEGFATYVAVSARPDLTSYSYRSNMESDYYFGGSPDDGSLIEPAVSAFLYDLTDSVIETHDSIAAPGSYVAAIISSCQVKYWGNSWRRADGADEIAYCVETTINPDSYLTARGATPDDYSESATQPASHSAARAHATWTWNMFDKS